MGQYRHYSFDLWNTLIRANPEFKKKRGEYICDRYGSKNGLTPKKVMDIFTDVNKINDQMVLVDDVGLTSAQMLQIAMFKIRGDLKEFSALEIELLYQDIEKIFLAYPPSLYDDDTFDVILELINRGRTLSILSNTASMRGYTLEKALPAEFLQMFMFRLYSDELGVCKPSAEAFTHVSDRLPYETEEIMHIGDNVICDFAGAQEYGFGAMLINSNSFTIKDML